MSLSEVADWLGIVGFGITIGGFLVTIRGVRKAKTAAESAARSAEETRSKLVLQATVSDLNRIVAEFDEIKMLQRARVWYALPTRYTSLRRQLMTVKENNGGLSKKDRAEIQGVIQQLMDIEDVVETALAASADPPDVASLLRLLSQQSEKISRVLTVQQTAIGE